MAFYRRRNYRTRVTRRRNYRRRNKYSKTERMAYEAGRVSVGRKNPDSNVSISFAKGVQSALNYKARCSNPNPRSMF